MSEAVIVAAVRSPIGRANKGSLTSVRADDLASLMVDAAVNSLEGFDLSTADDLMLGTAHPLGEGAFNMARVVAVLSGADTLAGVTVNRYCASSLQTTRMAFHAIRAGEGEIFISAGTESVSRLKRGASSEDLRNPRLAAARRRTAASLQQLTAWEDPAENGELPDIYISMGLSAENVASLHGVSRADQDEFALRSQLRAKAAIDRGRWAKEITPLTLADGSVVDADDCPRPQTSASALAALQPAFHEDGTVTAGNSCPLNDGAAALIVMSDQRAHDLGYTPLARIVASGVSGISPEIMGLGPVEATERVLSRARMSLDDIDLVELNEAFAAQALASIRELHIDMDKVNVDGGAIALGHPYGMTGARLTTTLINGLQEHDGQFGLVTLCVGGGQGMAMIIERLS